MQWLSGESMIALVAIYNYTNPAVDKFHYKFRKIARKNVYEPAKLRLHNVIDYKI